MITFVGAGPGAPDLITLRGFRAIAEADVIIYAGSLVSEELLRDVKKDCLIYNSAVMTLEEVIAVMEQYKEKKVVRLHTGDPSIYGAIREQMDLLRAKNIPFSSVPGVSSFCAAAAALGAEYTLPEVSQTLIISRMAGRTPVPEREQIRGLAAHGSSMVLFLSASLAQELQNELLAGAYSENTPAAVVYKASWPDEQVFRCTVGTLAKTVRENGIYKHTLLLIGDFLGQNPARSKLYDPNFTTEYRAATQKES